MDQKDTPAGHTGSTKGLALDLQRHCAPCLSHQVCWNSEQEGWALGLTLHQSHTCAHHLFEANHFLFFFLTVLGLELKCALPLNQIPGLFYFFL